MRCNQELVDLEPVVEPGDIEDLRALVQKHHKYTGSANAARVLDDWDASLTKFVKVYPRDYRRVIEAGKQAALQAVGSG
jgi:glutamate synthase domain-containing protein 3